MDESDGSKKIFFLVDKGRNEAKKLIEQRKKLHEH
jgi:hypothetical protein